MRIVYEHELFKHQVIYIRGSRLAAKKKKHPTSPSPYPPLLHPQSVTLKDYLSDCSLTARDCPTERLKEGVAWRICSSPLLSHSWGKIVAIGRGRKEFTVPTFTIILPVIHRCSWSS